MNTKDTLCIFIHYDSSGEYSKDDLHYIGHISSIFNEVVVLTSNNNEVTGFTNVRTINKMHNIGLDFGKLETFINSINIDDYDEMYLFNSSCLLVRDIAVSLNFMKKNKFDFWGYTTSAERRLHIQSYFLYFSNKALHLLKNFLSKNSPVNNNFSHEDIINNIEVPLLEYMHNNKMRCGAYIHFHKVFPTTKPSSNPTMHHPDKLLAINPHFPFLKKKVYTMYNISYIKHIESLV